MVLFEIVLLAAALTQSPVTIEPCITPDQQEFTCYKECGGPRKPTPFDGMEQFVHHPGNCLFGNITDKFVYSAPCNTSVKDQRFAFERTGTADAPTGVRDSAALLSHECPQLVLAMNPEKENKITYCITANCTIINSTDVLCSKGTRLSLAPCDLNWPGSPLPNVPDPRQVWSKGAGNLAFSEGGAWKLAATWHSAEHPKHGKTTVNSTSCMAAASFIPTPPLPPLPPLPPAAGPAAVGDVVMQPCIDVDYQDLSCVAPCGGPRHPSKSTGMNQFVHHNGSCLEGNLADKLLHVAPCNLTIKNQRFALYASPSALDAYAYAMNPEHENPITYCITANCTIISPTKVACEPGMQLGSTLPGLPDPRQIWTKGVSQPPDGGAVRLLYTWNASKHPKTGPPKDNSTSCLTAFH
eukprot:gene12330-1403_t